MRLTLILPLLVFLGLAAVFFGTLRDPDKDVLPSALIGHSVPDFALPPLDAGNPGLASVDLKDGQVKLINFWASWCAPCRVEHPLLMRIAGRSDVALYGVNYKDKPENARRFLAELGNPFATIATDRAGRTAIDFGVYGVPETYLVDGEGRILHRHVGPLSEDDWREDLLPLITSAASQGSGSGD